MKCKFKGHNPFIDTVAIQLEYMKKRTDYFFKPHKDEKFRHTTLSIFQKQWMRSVIETVVMVPKTTMRHVKPKGG